MHRIEFSCEVNFEIQLVCNKNKTLGKEKILNAFLKIEAVLCNHCLIPIKFISYTQLVSA